MSDETEAALTEAIAAHVQAEAPDYPLLTDWYVVAAGVGAEPSMTYYLHTCSDTPFHSLIGLLALAAARLDRESEDPEDD